MRSSSILVAGVALIALAGAPDRKIYDPARDPSKDLTVAMAEARADGKLVLLEVGGNWCGWCREFDRFVRADPEVEDALRCAFVVVRNGSPYRKPEDLRGSAFGLYHLVVGLGALLGDLLAYGIGRYFGVRLLRERPARAGTRPRRGRSRASPRGATTSTARSTRPR